MQIFKRKRIKMNPKMFIICDSKDDLKDLWMWCYEHDIDTNIYLGKWLDQYDRYIENKNGYYVSDPPMYLVDKEHGMLAYWPEKGIEGNVKEEYEFCRSHAIHAKDIDFDFLGDILNRR